jgi:hypothetical protein
VQRKSPPPTVHSMQRDEFPVTVRQRVRPTRIAFLVAPNDHIRYREIIQLNTVLWGGIYNPVIPLYRRRPAGLLDGRRRTGLDVTSGYIGAFEPDLLVSAVDIDPAKLRFDKTRFVTFDEFLNPHEDGGDFRHGTTITPLFADLYRREFQFEKRHRERVVQTSASDRDMQALVATCFGEFPTAADLQYHKVNYDEVFASEALKVDAGNFLEVHDLQYPLRVGSHELERRRRGSRGLTVFVMDGTITSELIDFWNLRAIGRNVIPAPIQWLDQMVDEFSQIAEREYRQHPRNPHYWFTTSVQKSRAVDKSVVEEFCRRIAGDERQRARLTTWYPRIWSSWARPHDGVERVEISAAERSTEVFLSGGHIRFQALGPPFLTRNATPGHTSFGWTTIVQVRQYGGDPWAAEVFPLGLERVNRLLGAVGLEPIWTSSEGINVAAHYPDHTEYWSIPRGPAVFEAWLRSKSYTFTLSAPGKLVREMLRRLGGRDGIRLIANEGLVKHLDRMASGHVETEYTDPTEPGRVRRARGNTASVGEMIGRLSSIHDANRTIAHNHLARLVERRVLQLGARLQCAQCSQWNWYPLSALREELTCERCLERFEFPLSSPPKDPWYYRTIGPFAVENFAQGAYSALLAFRFFESSSFAQATITPSFELTGGAGGKLEADFGMFWRKSEFAREEPLLILGECKSYDQFEKRDVLRMRTLGDVFPGAVLAFCTLRVELSGDEKRWLGSLAVRGRKSIGEDRWRNPVLILTATELFSEHGAPDCWKVAGGRFASFGSAHYVESEFNELCDVTQQLHLGVPSYADQLMQRRNTGKG